MIWQGLASFINLLIRAIGYALDLLISLLPTSPFVLTSSNQTIIDYLGMFNWFIPVSTMVGIATTWTSAVALYYIVMVALRWSKAIE